MIQAKADINIKDNSGRTPLHYAAFNCHMDAINALIQAAGVTGINIPDNNGNTPLHCAAFYGHMEAIEAFIQAKADINMKV